MLLSDWEKSYREWLSSLSSGEFEKIVNKCKVEDMELKSKYNYLNDKA